MKKLLTLLMLLCTVCTGAWAEIPSIFENGGAITLFNSNSYFAGSQTTATSTEVFKNIFVIEYNEDNTAFYLKRMNDGRYVPKYAGETIGAMTASKDDAETFDATIYNEGNKEFRLHPVSCENTMYLNSNGQNGTPKYASGIGAWSYWRISVKSLDDVKTIAKAEATTFTQKVNSLFSADALTAIENASTVDDIITAVNNFYASAAGKLFTYSSALRPGGPWYLNAQGSTTSLNTTTSVGPQNVFELVHVSGNGYKIRSKKFGTYLNQVNNNAGAISTVAEANASTYEILTSENDNIIELQFAGTTRGIHLDGGKVPCSWNSGSTENRWNIAVISDDDYAAMFKTINYTFTDGAGTQYTGSYTGGQGEMPSFTGVTGLTYQNVVWGGEGDNLTLTANIIFPFPVSKVGTDNWTYIGSFNDLRYLWYAKDNGLKFNKDVLPTSGTVNSYMWAIYPTFNDGAFTFKIKNKETGTYLAGTNTSYGPVFALSNEGKSYTFTTHLTNKNGFYDPATSSYITINSNTTSGEQNAFLWGGYASGSHNGSNMKFGAPDDFEALMAKLNKYVLGTGLGEYSTTEDNATKIAAVKAGTQFATSAEFTAMINACTINQPATEKYYRIKGVNPNDAGWYLTDNDGTLCSYTKDANNEKTVWYLTEDNKLKSKATGNYIKGVNMVENADEADVITFSASQYTGTDGRFVIGSYAIKPASYSEGRGLISWTSYHNYKIYEAGANDARCQWQIEEVVDELQTLITEATAIVEGNDGTTIGKPAKAVVDALAEAVATASAADPKTEETYNTLQTAVNAYFATTNVYLPTGYYKMHNFNPDGTTFYYAYNDYAREENTNHYTLMSTTAVNTNNGIWYVVNNGNGTITIKNGEGTSLKWDNTASETLTFGGYNKGVYAKCPGGIYFSQGLHGTDQDTFSISDTPKTRRATGWAHQDSEGSYWAFEPIATTDKIMNVIIRGDEGQGYVTYKNNQKAYNGGFFDYGTDAANKIDYSLAEIDGKAKAITTFNYTENPGTLIAEYIVMSDNAIEDLTENIKKINATVPYGMIGYPKYADPEIFMAMMEIGGYATMDDTQKEENFIDCWQYTQTILNSPNIVTPTPGGFYTFEDAEGNTETYYLTENNELLSYSNGQFAMPEYSEEKGKQIVDYAEIGTELGEGGAFAFMAARKNETGMPINFGKVCAMTDGAPLPSGDGNIYSGWTITKNDNLALTVKSSGYSTFYCPVDVQFDEATVYTAKIDEETRVITFTELSAGKVPAGTPVLVEKIGGGAADPTICTGAALDPVETGDLMGSYVSLPCVQDKDMNLAAITTVNGTDVNYHIYTMQSGTWKYYTGEKIPGFKAYFGLHDVTPEGNVKAYTFQFGDKVVTSIDELFGTTQPKQVFDLSGRQVNNAQRGLYIINGRKVIR